LERKIEMVEKRGERERKEVGEGKREGRELCVRKRERGENNIISS
jgi:hypothetical protein